ncbi:hypothetical protein V5799_019801 [Amblyomma americanum]|uniref:Uncharacterized protein n=1 Tax=Amblyomma americanum TaxID=6943 RepID=A0AAQ4EWA9_AMBAM
MASGNVVLLWSVCGAAALLCALLTLRTSYVVPLLYRRDQPKRGHRRTERQNQVLLSKTPLVTGTATAYSRLGNTQVLREHKGYRLHYDRVPTVPGPIAFSSILLHRQGGVDEAQAPVQPTSQLYSEQQQFQCGVQLSINSKTLRFGVRALLHSPYSHYTKAGV